MRQVQTLIENEHASVTSSQFRENEKIYIYILFCKDFKYTPYISSNSKASTFIQINLHIYVLYNVLALF